MDATQLRIILLIAGLVLIAAIYWFGRPGKPDQGRRGTRPRSTGGLRGDTAEAGRREPTLGDLVEDEQGGAAVSPRGEDPEMDRDIQAELELLERTLAEENAERDGHEVPSRDGRIEPGAGTGAGSGGGSAGSKLGERPDEHFDRILTLFVAARSGAQLSGPDLVVAAEKAGLIYGYMGIFHRLVDGHPEQGPVFSVANMIKPGNFELAGIQQLHTPGISFFMTLPTPVPALDAWDMMLPTAQRMAELLDAVVLDEERNALGRQRIAHIRDELRAYDRKRDALNQPPRW